ncbi:hypothetical protein [Amycolatopsis sp. WQ 127309]|nr:hypothetical protein [Amycolatopsis sp. WQ 127309]UOZ10552.1 hypothetical protein MUY22_20715 [Amycolatopsis sp. WQ 127309]
MTARWRDRINPNNKPDIRAPRWILWMLVAAMLIALGYAAWLSFGGCACR